MVKTFQRKTTRYLVAQWWIEKFRRLGQIHETSDAVDGAGAGCRGDRQPIRHPAATVAPGGICLALLPTRLLRIVAVRKVQIAAVFTSNITHGWQNSSVTLAHRSDNNLPMHVLLDYGWGPVRIHREFPNLKQVIICHLCLVIQLCKTSRWFRRRRAVGFDRAFGAIESNCPSASKSSRNLQSCMTKVADYACGLLRRLHEHVDNLVDGCDYCVV